MQFPTQYEDLFSFATELEKHWDKEGVSIDDSDAEKLVELLNDMGSDRAYHEKLTDICVYALSNEVWCTHEVATWPNTVTECLQQPIERYGYRYETGTDDNPCFEIVQVSLVGECTKVGTAMDVDTTLKFVEVLNGPDPIDPLPSITALINDLEGDDDFDGSQGTYVTLEFRARVKEEASIEVWVPNLIVEENMEELLDSVSNSISGTSYTQDHESWGKTDAFVIDLD